MTRQYIYFARNQLKSELFSWRVIMGYAIGIIGVLSYSINYLRYALPNSIQLFEPFVLYFLNRGNITFSLLGVFLIFSDAPFVTARSMSSMYRSTRKAWGCSTYFYIVMHSILFYFVLLLSSVLTVSSMSYVGNIWSKSIFFMIVHNDVIAVEQYGITIPSLYLLQNLSPVSAMLHSFFLICFYSIILGLCLYILNLCFKKIGGSIITFLIHFWGYVAISDSYVVPIETSLLAHSMLSFHGGSGEGFISLLFSYALFLLIMFVLWEVLKFVIKRVDLQISISGKMS